MRDGPENNPILDTCDEAYHSSRSPDRRSPCSPLAIGTAGCDDDQQHHETTASEKTQDDAAQKNSQDPIVEQVDAELHPEPKGFHSSDPADPSCEDQLLPASSPNQLATDAEV